MRTGLVTKKLGMSAVFDKQGRRIPVTLLKVDDCMIVGHRSPEKDGVLAVRVGHGKVSSGNPKINKPQKSYYLKTKLEFRRHIVDFKVSDDALVEVGTNLNADHYVEGQFVDVIGTSTGKGFAGAMKRHGFRGLRASHGVSISHRSHGSTGNRQDPGKVFKNKKMAGHMGCCRVTTQNLEILSVNLEKNLLVIKGAVPGTDNSYVIVRDAKKTATPPNVPYPCVKAEKTSADNSKEQIESGENNG